MPARRRLSCSLGAALLLGLAACGGAEEGTAAPAPSAPPPSSAAPAPDPAADVAAVEATWTEWTAAVAAGDNAKRAELVATRTLDHYDNLRDLALTATENELRVRAGVKEQFTVYELRAGRVPVEVLRTAEPRQLYQELLATSAVVGQEATDYAQPDVRATDVQLLPSGNSAFARLTGPNGSSSFQIRFEREEGRWRLDLMPIITVEAERFRLEASIEVESSVPKYFDVTLPEVYGPALAEKVRQPLGA